jgi:inositol transport system ATP-binding protein
VAEDATPLLRMSAVSKKFPGVQALDAVDFEVRRGEVHALLGENGAGKSTLLKILSGAQAPDGGTIELDGRPVTLANPHEAQRLGIVTIYQEFNLVPSQTVAENVFIGREPGRGPFVDWRRMARQTAEATGRLGLTIDPMAFVRDLSVAEQQMVEIARALSMDSRLIVMDEPTSALSESEVEKLFAIVSDLRAHGIAVIFVTHRLEEVVRICDRFTVLRDGRLAGTGTLAEAGIDDIIRLMVGRHIELALARDHSAEAAPGPVALAVEHLSRRGNSQDPHASVLEDVSFEARAGEVLGIAGLVGAGRTELARAIFGADPFDSGRVLVGGEPVTIRSPHDAIRHGIGLVPEDRKQQALFLALAVRANVSIASLHQLGGWLGLMDEGREARLVEEFRGRLNIRMAGPEQQVQNLSGGNQQKVVLARWLALRPRVLIVDEPTRGIDVASKAEVHQLLHDMARQGVAVIAISSELPEILGVSDRIMTMREGRITGTIGRAEATQEILMRMMTLGAGARAA